MKKTFTLPVLFVFWFILHANILSAQNDPCEIFDIKATTNSIPCDVSSGSIWIDIIGGQTGIYEIEWYNPATRITRKATSFTDGYDITSLSEGTYILKVTDFRTRCTVRKEIAVSKGAFPVGTEIIGNPVTCDGFGTISVRIPVNTKPPFQISLKGPQSENYVANSNNFKIYNLPSGDYEFSLTENGCVATTTINIPTTPGLPHFTLEDEKGACNISSGNIIMRIQDGTPGYQVTIDGPTSGTVSVSDPAFRISDLSSGAYKITLEDANGCLSFGFIEIDRVGLSVALAATKANCNQNGAIKIDISKGTGPYTVLYRGGGIEGSKVIDGHSTTISGPEGNYLVEIKDVEGCNTFATASIELEVSDLYCSITPTTTTCNEENGAINIFISGGKKPYSLSYSGPVSHSEVVNGTTSFENLPAGVYTTFLQDAAGCSVSESTEIVVGGSETASPSFSYVATGYSVFFSNSTESSGAYLWTFGDGTSTAKTSPSHDYQEAGSYEVCLSQTGACNTGITCQTIQIVSFKDISGLLAPIGATSAIFNEPTTDGENVRINQNYPNPFVHQTDILFELPEALQTTIMIHDNTGKVVQTHTTNYEKGVNLFTFNQNNLTAGVYYYTIKAGTFSATKKMIIR